MSADPPSDDRPPAVRVTAAKCARCGKPVQPRYRPFCSQRCAEIDLGSWFTGRYRVATDEAPSDAPPKGEEES
jgi:endogenous inhibitor of DNA gyrase (YacG/DUF329 family)